MPKACERQWFNGSAPYLDIYSAYALLCRNDLYFASARGSNGRFGSIE